MMDLDQLQSVRDRERQTDKLQQLRDSFYAESAALVADLREQREQAAAEADDPFADPTVARLSDRLATAEQTVEAVYEKRVGKIVRAATFAAADMPADVEGMTEEERDLFEALVADIRTNRQRVLDAIEGDDSSGEGEAGDGATGDRAPGVGAGGESQSTPEDRSDGGPSQSSDRAAGSQDGDGREPPPEAEGGEPGPSPAGEDETDPGSDPPAGQREPQADGAGTAARDQGGQSAAGPASASAASVPRTRIRVTADVGEIFGVDEREYHLEAGDVVTLPTANADPLLDRDAAERVE